jgi:hypothetical protein
VARMRGSHEVRRVDQQGGEALEPSPHGHGTKGTCRQTASTVTSWGAGTCRAPTELNRAASAGDPSLRQWPSGNCCPIN